jgi:Phosphotransferase enzyme family
MTTRRVEGIERAIFGYVSEAEVDGWLDRLVSSRLSTGMRCVLFRSGRVSAVYGLQLDDGTQVVVKVHRGHPDMGSLAAAVTSQRRLAEHGYPAPLPIDGPSVFDDHVAVIETLLDRGSPADAHDPVVQHALAASLVDQIRILAEVEIPSALTVRPAWAIYQRGPWPSPHDPIFDFATTPTGFEWLDAFAQYASDMLVSSDLPPTVGHSDWNPGNVLVADGVVTAAFDWDSLIVDSEAMIAGLAAGQCTSGSTAWEGPTPEEVAAFITDYAAQRGVPFSALEQRTALGAALWQLAYNARCQLSWFGPVSPPEAGSMLAALANHRDRYLDLE